MKLTAARSFLLGVFLAAAAHGQSRQKLIISKIEDNMTGWGSCTTCAGGANNADVFWEAQFQSTPSQSGSSTQFYVSANNPYSDVLFWDKLGAQSWATEFTWNFWVQVDSASSAAHALEYDFFQFVGANEYMFGTQCVYTSGLWNVWNGATNRWVPIPVSCTPFTPNVWHHVVLHVHRTVDTRMHFDWLAIDGVQRPLNSVQPSGPLPAGWKDNMGVQWQLDSGSAPISFNEWIDNVTLTIN